MTVGRELTKQFEEVATVPCGELPAWLSADSQRTRGEFALVLHAAPEAPQGDEGRRVLALLLKELPVKSAVKLAAEITGAPRNELYEAALRMKDKGCDRARHRRRQSGCHCGTWTRDPRRLPIVYMKLEGLSVVETARLTGMSESAVKVGVHRGLKALAAKTRGDA